MRNDIQALREAKGLSRAELGAALRHPVSRQTIHSTETGKYEPSCLLALDLAHYFGKHVEEIFHVEAPGA